MLLLITGSRDGTSDAIVSKLGQQVFRLNYDLYSHYSLEFTPNYWKITNPVGHTISSDTVTSCFWWKAFNFSLEGEDNYVVEEVKYIFRELYAWCKLRSLVKGNPFDFHNYLGKTNILGIAAKSFQVPKSLVSFKCAGVESFSKSTAVAKSLTSALTDSKASLLATEVEIARLDSKFPWFLQEKVDSDYDITVFICGERQFAYQRSRKDLKGLDWRGEQTFDPDVKEWLKFDLTDIEKLSIHNFCKDINVTWGRLDFMRSNGNLVFLEFNANGQWLFLDYDGSDGLLNAVLDYLH